MKDLLDVAVFPCEGEIVRELIGGFSPRLLLLHLIVQH